MREEQWAWGSEGEATGAVSTFARSLADEKCGTLRTGLVMVPGFQPVLLLNRGGLQAYDLVDDRVQSAEADAVD